MANLKITAKDGKILSINVPEGTDPSQYDSVVDDVMRDYESKQVPSTLQETGTMPNLPQSPVGVPGGVAQPMGIGSTRLTGPAPTPQYEMDQAGQALAEDIGATGHPILGAAVGTAFQMSPDIALGALPGMKAAKALGKSATPIVKRASKLFAARSPKVVGAEIEAVERAAGARPSSILKETLPKVGRTADKARVEIDRIARTLDRAKEKGADLSSKWLLRQKDRLGLILDKYIPKPGEVSQAGRSLGQDAVAKASKIKEMISQSLGKKIPERVPLAEEFAAGMTREKALKKAGQGVPNIIRKPFQATKDIRGYLFK